MMKKTYKLLFTVLFISINLNPIQAQLTNLTYTVRATNFALYDSITFTDPSVSGLINIMEYDLYIQQTNVPATNEEIMRFALGTYYINLNWGYNVATPTIADTAGFAKFSYIVGSTDFTNLTALPTTPHVKPVSTVTDGGSYWPPNDITNGIRGGYLNLNSNFALGNTSDVQISQVYPGTRVGRFRLKKNVTASWPSPYFEFEHFHLRWRLAPAINPNNPNPVSKVYCYDGLGGVNTEVTNKGTWVMDTTNIIFPISKTANLSLKLLMEGIYYPIFNQMARKDFVTVFLRNAEFPYTIVDSAKSLIDSISFTGIYHFVNIPLDTYYIVVKHFNSLEVWSKAGGEIFGNGGVYNYDLTTSASQAFGNNLKHKGMKYCLYSGDVNQDAIIDASDVSEVENSVRAGASGYISTDLNGDNIVDATDLSIVDNNKDLGIIVITP